MKRFLISLVLALLIFIAGAAVGRFVLTPPVEIVTIDVEKLAWLLEKYNTKADEIKKEMAKIKIWNKNALIKPPEFEPEKEKK